MTDRPDRIPCIRPGCRRTASREKMSDCDEIVCGKCWRTLVPPRLKHRYKLIRAKLRGQRRRRVPDDAMIRKLYAMDWRNWEAIRAALTGSELPQGLAAWLEENRL